MSSRNNTHKRDDRGVVAIEFVWIAPVLLAFIIAIAQFGVFFAKKVDVETEARAAARTLALRGTPSYPTSVSVSGVVPCAPGDTTSNASVTLTTSYQFSIPFVSLGAKPITATGRMRCGG